MYVAVGDNLGFAEAIGEPTADGEAFVVSSVRYQNLTDKPMVFTFKRGNGAAMLTRTVNPGTPLTTNNVPGSVANRTLVTIAMSWG